MGFLSQFFKPAARGPAPLPSGSFTVDPEGRIITSTVPSSFAPENLARISVVVLSSFHRAKAIGISLAELTVSFGAMNIKAREMRGGAIIFLSPRTPVRK